MTITAQRHVPEITNWFHIDIYVIKILSTMGVSMDAFGILVRRNAEIRPKRRSGGGWVGVLFSFYFQSTIIQFEAFNFAHTRTHAAKKLSAWFRFDKALNMSAAESRVLFLSLFSYYYCLVFVFIVATVASKHDPIVLLLRLLPAGTLISDICRLVVNFCKRISFFSLIFRCSLAKRLLALVLLMKLLVDVCICSLWTWVGFWFNRNDVSNEKRLVEQWFFIVWGVWPPFWIPFLIADFVRFLSYEIRKISQQSNTRAKCDLLKT